MYKAIQQWYDNYRTRKMYSDLVALARKNGTTPLIELAYQRIEDSKRFLEQYKNRKKPDLTNLDQTDPEVAKLLLQTEEIGAKVERMAQEAIQRAEEEIAAYDEFERKWMQRLLPEIPENPSVH